MNDIKCKEIHPDKQRREHGFLGDEMDMEMMQWKQNTGNGNETIFFIHLKWRHLIKMVKAEKKTIHDTYIQERV